MNISPNHSHTEFNSDLEIHVTGGERIEREFLVDMVSSSLKNRGFDKVHAIGIHGFDNGNAIHNPKSVFDAIKDLRPDLITKDIAVTMQSPAYGLMSAPVDISGTSADGQASLTKAATKVEDFLSEARDRDVADKITVSGFDPSSVARAAQKLLTESPGSEVTMKVQVQPWQRPYKPAYTPPYDYEAAQALQPAQPMKTY